MDIEFTTKAQDALGAAVRRAAANGNAEVQPVHLLDALLGQGEGIATALLESVGADRRVLAAAVAAEMGRLPSAAGSTVGTPGLSRTMYAVLQAAQAQLQALPSVLAPMKVFSRWMDEMPMIAMASFTFSTLALTWLSHSGWSGCFSSPMRETKVS